MPSFSLDPNDPKTLARMLVALVREHGGELRVKALTFDGLERGVFLVTDFDRVTLDIVIRCTTESGRVTVVTPEAYSWTRPPEETAGPGIEAQRNVQRRTVRSDEELAALEEARNREAELARESREGSTTTRFRTENAPAAAQTRNREVPPME